jgi:hypothetical protein
LTSSKLSSTLKNRVELTVMDHGRVFKIFENKTEGGREKNGMTKTEMVERC